jgi:hypothetical protein
MNTKQQKMKCSDFNIISLQFLDQELADDVKIAAQAHLSSCTTCASYLNRIDSIYSQTGNVLTGITSNPYFYSRLKARMEADTVIARKPFFRLSYYLQPALYLLIGFTILISVVMISSTAKNKQLNTSTTLVQPAGNDEQEYLQTLAFNDQTFEEAYLNLITND